MARVLRGFAIRWISMNSLRNFVKYILEYPQNYRALAGHCKMQMPKSRRGETTRMLRCIWTTASERAASEKMLSDLA